MKKKKITENEENTENCIVVEFGQRVKSIRKGLDFSQREFALELGMSSSFLSEIEYGRTRPGFDFLYNIHTKFDVDIYYLMKGTGKPFITPEDQQSKQKIFPGPDGDIVEKMLRHFEDAPMVRMAVLEFYMSYIFKNKELIADAIKTSTSEPPKPKK